MGWHLRDRHRADLPDRRQGLADGNNGSRLIVAIVSVISIVGGVLVAISQSGRAGYSGWSSVFWGVVILLIL